MLVCLSASCLAALAALADAAVSDDSGMVSAKEQNSAPQPSKPKISFTSKSGLVVSNADVVRTNDGVSLVWEKDGGASGGLVRLEDLPEDLRNQFGYDPAKTAAADKLARERQAQWQQAVAASALAAQRSQETAAQSVNTNSASYQQPVTAASHPVRRRVYVRHHYHTGTRQVLINGS